MAFEDTANKALIRGQFDLPLIRGWRAEDGQPLSYFGLTGPMVRDLLDWREHLNLRTAVELVGKSPAEKQAANQVVSTMKTTLFVQGLTSGFQVLRGDIEEVIHFGVDADGSVPQCMEEGVPAREADFQYDLVNLDFDGGLYYKNASRRLSRIDAIRRVIERHRGKSFLLMITINVRDTLANEPDRLIGGLVNLHAGTQLEETLRWHLNADEGTRHYKLKMVVPYIVQRFAEPLGFTVVCRPPVFYVGHQRARMLHFAFELRQMHQPLGAVSAQTLLHLSTMPLLNSENGQFVVDRSIPGCPDEPSIREELEFIGADLIVFNNG